MTGPPPSRRLLAVILIVCAGALLSILLPSINLSGEPADTVVRLSDTGSSAGLPILSLIVLGIAVVRPGLTGRRRSLETIAVLVAMLVVMAGGSLLNEGVIKPTVGVPRPNIVALAESGALGPGIATADDFYAVGSVEKRRELMDRRLTPERTPYLSELVRSHWIHAVGYSMPSGHATAAMTFAILWAGLGLAWLDGWRRFLAVVIIPIWSVAITWSRVLLEVHTTADVTVGALAGSAWGLGAYLAIARLLDLKST